MTRPMHYRQGNVRLARVLRSNSTEAEKKLWSRLRGNQLSHHFRRQAPIGHYVVDFVCWKQKVVIEVDGSQHYTAVGIERDKARDKFLGTQGFRVLHLSAVEVMNNTDGVVLAILENLKNPL